MLTRCTFVGAFHEEKNTVILAYLAFFMKKLSGNPGNKPLHSIHPLQGCYSCIPGLP